MKPAPLTLPLFLIIAGALWLLNSMDLFPSATVIVACALAATGILVFVFEGFNKQSVVTAPLLMYIGFAVYASSEYGYAASTLTALGMILLGSLMLLARSDAVPSKGEKSQPPAPPRY